MSSPESGYSSGSPEEAARGADGPVEPVRAQQDEVDADEGEPDVAPFAGDEQTLGPRPGEDIAHDYGYE